MELSTVCSRAQRGVEAPPVRVETHLSNGLPAFNIVGLPATAVRESKERVRSALLNSHFEWPARRLTVNLAPADLPKDGGRFDLPIALGILAASGQLPPGALQHREFLGELALDGSLRAVSGVVPAAIACQADRRSLVAPADNAIAAALVKGARVIAATNLLELCALLRGAAPVTYVAESPLCEAADYPDLGDVRGQSLAKRALEVAACGGHNLLFSGPPGTGKTMLATRLTGILPPLAASEMLDILAMHSATDSHSQTRSLRRPFRSPHHSASARALAGGGSCPRAGEVSLAHHGILFLDELAEFPRSVLDVLREPLESGEITISRALQKVTFPARFQLVAAMNPCPCGFHGDRQHACRCGPAEVQRYRQRISGPLLDRFDLLLVLNRIAPGDLLSEHSEEERSDQVRARVVRARNRALDRQGGVNAQLSGAALAEHCGLEKKDRLRLERTAETLGLSMRGLQRVLRVARSIADLAGCERIAHPHLVEAVAYRQPAVVSATPAC